jgi:hypothetical protein
MLLACRGTLLQYGKIHLPYRKLMHQCIFYHFNIINEESFNVDYSI